LFELAAFYYSYIRRITLYNNRSARQPARSASRGLRPPAKSPVAAGVQLYLFRTLEFIWLCVWSHPVFSCRCDYPSWRFIILHSFKCLLSRGVSRGSCRPPCHYCCIYRMLESRDRALLSRFVVGVNTTWHY